MFELKSWFNKEIYNEQFELSFYDCDIDEKMKLSKILAISSDSAGKEYICRDITREKMIEEKQIMLLSRYHVKINRLPKRDEILTLKTWEKGVQGPLLLRDCEIIDSNKKSCVKIASTWFIVNPETRTFIRPKNFKFKEFKNSNIDNECSYCKKLLFDEEKSEYVGSHKVTYSELDGNGHLNNANYANIIYDLLMNINDTFKITDFYINYVKEAKVNDVIKLYKYYENNRWHIVGKISGKTSFISEVN